RPFKSDEGFFRMRLLDYQPSTPAAVDDADGKIVPAIRERALADMIAERAREINHGAAEEFESKLRQHFIAKEDGKPVPDAELAASFDALPTETLTYLEITDSQYAIGRLPVGDMMGPLPYADPDGGSGEEIIVMAERRVPTRADFAAETDEVKTQFRGIATTNYQGNFGFTYTLSGPSAIIQPSPSIMAGLADRFEKGLLSINPDLVRPNEGEG
ncbi:MAG: hypothetical protein LBS30_07585, partial [Planctomycetota bacterium]|nr:hypothetical protein [Planctomycetota bacterium]